MFDMFCKDCKYHIKGTYIQEVKDCGADRSLYYCTNPKADDFLIPMLKSEGCDEWVEKDV